jgi:hypothetical protein
MLASAHLQKAQATLVLKIMIAKVANVQMEFALLKINAYLNYQVSKKAVLLKGCLFYSS